MSFEGTEKKLEIVLEKHINLLELSVSFWENLVNSCDAKILSTIENSFSKAFVLSESSLFICKNSLILITCGRTNLIGSLKFFFNKFKKEEVKFLVYQRKNEFFPHKQRTSAYDDLKEISQLIPGEALRLGKLDGHHMYVFYTLPKEKVLDNDRTLELLMYHLKETESFLANSALLKKRMNEIKNLFPNFIFNEHFFEPHGYSLNGLSPQGDYLTIHMTPEEECSYMSFETNIESHKDHHERLQQIIEIISPESFDYVGHNFQLHEEDYVNYEKLQSSSFQMKSLYELNFIHYTKKNISEVKPEILNLSE